MGKSEAICRLGDGNAGSPCQRVLRRLPVESEGEVVNLNLAGAMPDLITQLDAVEIPFRIEVKVSQQPAGVHGESAAVTRRVFQDERIIESAVSHDPGVQIVAMLSV